MISRNFIPSAQPFSRFDTIILVWTSFHWHIHHILAISNFILTSVLPLKHWLEWMPHTAKNCSKTETSLVGVRLGPAINDFLWPNLVLERSANWPSFQFLLTALFSQVLDTLSGHIQYSGGKKLAGLFLGHVLWLKKV